MAKKKTPTAAAKPVEGEEEVQDQSVDEDSETSTDLRYQISSYGADYPVDGLVKRLGQGDIILPEFQRQYVWPRPQASRFVESLLLGLPVPAIFLSKDPETQKLLVIDGQQRLNTLRFFYDGLIREREFALQGVNKPFEGLTYKTLEPEDRRRLDDSIIHAIIVRQENPADDDSSIFLVFERLNTTSTPLSAQEIRACVFHGKFNDYLNDRNNNPSWRKIYGPPSLRQKDKELLLRFFALHYALDTYARPMKVFLSNFMRSNRDLEQHTPRDLDDAFEPTVQLVDRVLGPKAFRPERALNASVTDAILVGTARRLQQGALKDEQSYKEHVGRVLADPEFMSLNTAGTTNVENVTGRIEKIAASLAEVD